LVPTLPFTDDRQTQERYALAHNRTQELGAYDDKALATLLSDLSSQDALPGTGFDQGDLDALVAGLGNALLADQKDSTVVPVEIRLSVPPRVWLTMQQEIQDAIVAAVQPFGVECTWPD
jgi:hypothetical protein